MFESVTSIFSTIEKHFLLIIIMFGSNIKNFYVTKVYLLKGVLEHTLTKVVVKKLFFFFPCMKVHEKKDYQQSL